MSISLYPISGDAISAGGALTLKYDSDSLLDAVRITGDQTPDLLYGY